VVTRALRQAAGSVETDALGIRIEDVLRQRNREMPATPLRGRAVRIAWAVLILVIAGATVLSLSLSGTLSGPGSKGRTDHRTNITENPTAVASPPSWAGLGAAAFDTQDDELVVVATHVFAPPDEAASTQTGMWSWNGRQWFQLHPTTMPPPLSYFSMAYDSATNQLVLFGGIQANQATNVPPYGHTWTWNGNDWVEQHPVSSPPARSEATMAYDAAARQVVLFGGDASAPGFSSSYLADTWTWDGNDWTVQHPSTVPPPRVQATMAYDNATRQVVLFGGIAQGPSHMFGPPLLGDTWTWDGRDWVQRHSPQSPGARAYAGMGYDSSGHDVVLVGGITSGSIALILNDTWLWTGSSWTMGSSRKSLPGFSQPLIAQEPQRSGAVLFGGNTGSVGGTSINIEIWTWNDGEWTDVGKK